MKKKYLLITVIVILIALLVEVAILFVFNKNKNKMDDNEIFATYKNGVVYVKDVRIYLKKLEDTFNQKIDINNLKTEEKKLIADEIVNSRIVLEQAKNSNISKTEEYKNKLKENEELILREMYIQGLVDKQITDEAIKNKYEELKKMVDGKKEYKVKQIVAKTKGDIEKAIEELKTKTFEEVAEKYSAEDRNGGNLGYILEGQTVPEFENVIKSTPLNKLSKPFETKVGWHVIIKEDERNATVPEFDKTKDIIKTSLTTEFIRNYSLNNLKDINVELKK